MGEFETMTRAERLGLPVHKAKKNKANKNVKSSYLNWRDIQEIFEPLRDEAFSKVEIEKLAKIVKKPKHFGLALNAVNDTIGELEDGDNGIRVSAKIIKAILSPKTGNIIFYIKGCAEYGDSGESFIKYRIEYCDEDICVFEMIDSAFDALEEVIRHKYGQVLAAVCGKEDDNLLLD